MIEILAFERDPRLTRLDTTVVRAGTEGDRTFVVLADTVLYPEGGGQPADRGAIEGRAVLDVQRVDGVVRHYTDGPVPAGPASVTLDWARRFDHMQQHTAQHLLTAVAEARFGWSTVAFHLGERTSDIVLDTPGISDEKIRELEEAVAVEVRTARPVTARRVTQDAYAGLAIRSRGLPEGHVGDVRLVEIDGVDVNTCGGTHCASTAELEAVKLLGTESVRDGTRLFYVAGGRLRRLLGVQTERARELRSLLGMSDEELVEGVSSKLTQLKDTKRSLRQTEEALAGAVAEAFVAGGEPLLFAHWPDRGLPFLQRVAAEVLRRGPSRMVLLTSGEDPDGAFVVAAGEDASLDVPDVGARVAEILGGRGGGAGRIYQGRATRLSKREEARALLP